MDTISFIILYVPLSSIYWFARAVYLTGNRQKYEYCGEKQIHRRCWLEVLVWPICTLYFLIIWLAKLPFKFYSGIKTYCVWLFSK